MKLLPVFVLIFGIYFVQSKRETVFAGKHVICKEFNKNYLYNVTCGIKLVNRNKQTYSLHFSAKPVVVDNLHVWYSVPLIRMITYYKFQTQYHPHGVYIDEDACAYLKFLKGTKLLSFTNFVNLPVALTNITCPIKGPLDVIIKDVEIIPLHLSDYVNKGDWIFESITYTIVDKKEIILLNVKNYFGIQYIYSKS